MTDSRALAFALMLGAVSCSRAHVNEAPAVDGAAALSPTQPVTASTPTPPVPTTVTVSFATFTPKDTLLDECVDFTFAVPPGVDAGPNALDAFANAFAAQRNGMSRIYKSCAEQFRTTPALARCTANISLPFTNDAGVARAATIESVERYYDLDMLTKNNVYMKDCLDMKGDWQGLDKNSAAYHEAVRAKLQRDLDKIGQ